MLSALTLPSCDYYLILVPAIQDKRYYVFSTFFSRDMSAKIGATKEKLIFLCNCFQPNTLQEATVDPVHDDIEITSEGEGTDAFAVSTDIETRICMYITSIHKFKLANTNPGLKLNQSSFVLYTALFDVLHCLFLGVSSIPITDA